MAAWTGDNQNFDPNAQGYQQYQNATQLSNPAASYQGPAPTVPTGGAASSGGGSNNGTLGSFINSGLNFMTGAYDPTQSSTAQMLTGNDRALYNNAAVSATQLFGTPYGAEQIGVKPFLQAGTTGAGLTQAQTAQAGYAPAVRSTQQQGVDLNAAQANATAAQQNQLAGSLQNTIAGNAPSVAQEQLRQATAANVNQQAAQAQSMHGAARLAALRNAQQVGASTQQTAASQMAAQRAQEIATAQGQLGNNLASQRGQDISQAGTQAQLAQTTATNNAGYQQTANLANAGYQQQTNLANAGYQQSANQFNAQNANQVSQFNAGAANQAAANYAQQYNSGNLAIGQANQQSVEATQTLNNQQNAQLIDALNANAKGQTGIDTGQFTAQTDYAKQQAQNSGNFLGSVASGLVGAAALL